MRKTFDFIQSFINKCVHLFSVKFTHFLKNLLDCFRIISIVYGYCLLFELN